MKVKQINQCRMTSFLFIFSLILTVVLSGCGNSDKGNDQEDSEVSSEMLEHPEEGSKEKPDFDFEKETHDFGKIKEGEKVSHSFKFTNTGQQPLIITDAAASCGCTVPNYPKKPVKPGESALIDVAFDSDGKPGSFKKSVTLKANTVPNTKKIFIKGEVIKKQ